MKRTTALPLLLAVLLVVIAGLALLRSPASTGTGDSAAVNPADFPRGKVRPDAGPDRGGDRSAPPRDVPENRIWVDGTYENNLVGEMLEPFDGQALREQADRPEASRDERKLTELLLRATGEKDASFRDLLARPELRKASSVDLALCAYEYAIDGSPEALQRILDRHLEAVGNGSASWDSDATWILSHVDEWELTREALKASRLSGDGAGGDSRYAFWLRRRYLFPHHPTFPADYEAFYREIYGEN